MRLIMIFVLVLAVTGPSVAGEDAERLLQTRPKSPEASRRAIEVRAGFHVELVASEPLVADPVAIAFGPDGRLWVTEMGDYPAGSPEQHDTGRIRYLEDTTGDGSYDKSTVFLDGLQFPTGVMPWGRGVLVTAAPDIFYAEDTSGDGKADRREVWFTGFAEGNPQHRVNGLRWGLDNWIHGANGQSGGIVTSAREEQQTDIHGHDFRIDPRRGVLELVSGMSQFGRPRDDWGNWFGGNSDWPFWHAAIEDRYLRRNPYLKPPDPRIHLMDPPANAPIFPISQGLPRFNQPDHANRITSACGPAVYRDELFGADFAKSFFVCEPEHNLVHRQNMFRRGATFYSERAADERDSEFLASRDVWFRPTQVRTGPDGALWIVDMYRLVIEHPDYMLDQLHEQFDLRAGSGKGRIYRVYPVDQQPRPIARLDRLGTAELVAAMDSPNGPQRDMVQQLLVERQDKAAIGPLKELVLQSDRAACRLIALGTLDGLNAASSTILIQALSDPHPALRRHALRLAEPLLDSDPQLQKAVLERVDDPDAQVRLQLAFTLGYSDDPRAGRTLARIAAADVGHDFAGDELLAAAVMSSAGRFPDELLAELFEIPDPSPPQVEFINTLLRSAIWADQEQLLAAGLRKVAQAGEDRYQRWQFDVLAGVLDDLNFSGIPLKDRYRESNDPLKGAIEALDEIFLAARSAVADPQQPLELRASAVRLLGRGVKDQDADVDRLATLLDPRSPGRLQQAAVAGLGGLDRADVPELVLQGWASHGPELRAKILDVLLSRTSWTLQLLDRVESQQLPFASLTVAHQSQLLLHSSAEVRQRTAALMETSPDSDRREVVDRYRNVIDLAGDPRRGEPVFQEHCSACHRLEGFGYEVGPNLLALSDRSPEALLAAILDPGRNVDLRYHTYHAVTVDGRIFTGILTNETGNSITLLGPHGQRHLLLRDQLQELVSTGQTLMPDGLEKTISEPQQFADLIAYLRAVSD